jgi:hypothetical protein
MPTTKKQKRVACAIAHGAKLDRVKMPKKVAKEMCNSKIKRRKGKR